MMNKRMFTLLLVASLSAAAPVLAAPQGYRPDVAVQLPPEVWDAGNASRNAAPPCDRCCIYNDQNYSEGAVVTVKNVVLQCVRDPNVLSTGGDDLHWQRLDK